MDTGSEKGLATHVVVPLPFCSLMWEVQKEGYCQLVEPTELARASEEGQARI